MIGKPFKKGYTPWNKGMKNNYSVNKGSNHPRWKGGRRVVKGYVWIYSPNHPNRNIKDCVPEHRLIMEKEIGRYLTKKEIVHHKNGVKGDNRIENLQLIPKSKFHSKNSNHLKIRCPHCDKDFTYKHC